MNYPVWYLPETGGGTLIALIAIIGFFYTNNMLLMVLPERFGGYFSHRNGSLLVFDQPGFWRRFFHMMLGALAVGGLFVGLLGRLRKKAEPALAAHAEAVGISTFFLFTLVASIVCIGWLLQKTFAALPER